MHPDEIHEQLAAAQEHLSARLSRKRPSGVYFCIVKKGNLRFDSVTVALNDTEKHLRLADDVDRSGRFWVRRGVQDGIRQIEGLEYILNGM